MVSVGRATSIAIREIGINKLPPNLVRTAWEAACKRWSIYGYTKPRINRSILDGRGIHECEIAYLNFSEKRVTVNLHRLDQHSLLDLLESIFTHELGHKLCPENLKTKLLIDHAVMQVVEDDFAAANIGNIYRDMLVNVESHRRGDKGIPEVYARLWEDNPDPIQQLIGRAYEKLFQRQDTSKSYMQGIIHVKLLPELETAADKVVSIILNSKRSNWLRSAREFAEILKQHAPSMDAEKIYVISNCQSADFSPEGKSPIPPKGRSDVKELEKRLGGIIYELNDEEKRQPCSIPEFKKFLDDSKIKIADEEALIWYYRDLIGGRVVKVPEVSVSSGLLYPYTPKTWRPGDPPHQLDITLSKSIGGVLIPGVTTKKWEFKRGKHLTVGKDYPDLDLWIDSSGSMQDPAKGISHAVSSGMIVAKSFLATRKSVRVINWSGTEDGGPLFEGTAGFMRDEDEVDRKLIKYFKDHTVLPIDEIEKPYAAGGKPASAEASAGKQKYIVMITDLEIQNLTEGTINRLRKVFESSVGGTIFLIGEGKEGEQKIFKDIGFDVVPVKNVADLDQHALKLTKKLFEERMAR
jgi:hypothetical protein